MVITYLYYRLLNDLVVFLNCVSAVFLVCGMMLRQVGLFLLTLAVDNAITALATSDQQSLGRCRSDEKGSPDHPGCS